MTVYEGVVALVWLLMPIAGVLIHRLTEGRRAVRRNISIAAGYYAILGVVFGTRCILHRLWPAFSALDLLLIILVVLSPLFGFCIAVAPPVEKSGKISMKCHVCGYNLTGNVSGRCPECGTPVDLLKQ